MKKWHRPDDWPEVERDKCASAEKLGQLNCGTIKIVIYDLCDRRWYDAHTGVETTGLVGWREMVTKMKVKEHISGAGPNLYNPQEIAKTWHKRNKRAGK